MRLEEEFCRRCFDGYLRGRLGLQAAWRPGPATGAPDYFVEVEGSTFAVEVTRLIGRVGGPQGPSMGDAQYEASMQGLCAEIRDAAFQAGVVRGLYVVHFVGPFRDWGRARRLITARVLEHVRSTRRVTTMPRQVILSETAEQLSGPGMSLEAIGDAVGSVWISGSCSIAKLAESPDRIHCVTTAPGRAMWEGEVLAEACRLLQRALIKKKSKLTDIGEAKILLLRHEWPMADGSVYRGCVEGLKFLDCFHSIFVVETEDEGYFLHTDDPRWGTCL